MLLLNVVVRLAADIVNAECVLSVVTVTRMKSNFKMFESFRIKSPIRRTIEMVLMQFDAVELPNDTPVTRTTLQIRIELCLIEYETKLCQMCQMC